MRNSHFLFDKLNKPIFHMNLDIFFPTYFSIHLCKTLLINETLYKSMFNMPYSAIFFESFDGFRGEDNYLLGIVLPYLKSHHFSRYGIFTYVQHNPFGRSCWIDCNDHQQFKMLFLKCSSDYKPSFCNSAKLKMKQKIIFYLFILIYLFEYSNYFFSNLLNL
jgi:hypothetical protein